MNVQELNPDSTCGTVGTGWGAGCVIKMTGRVSVYHKIPILIVNLYLKHVNYAYIYIEFDLWLLYF